MAMRDDIPGSSRWRRTRDAIRGIRRLPISDRDKKEALAEWFQEHRRAAATPGQKRAAYNELLGRDRNRRMRG